MKVETPKFNVEYQGATFTFKFGTNKDLLEIIKASRGQGSTLTEHFQSRLVEVKGLEIDGREGGIEDVLDLPQDILAEIIIRWQQATIDKINGKTPKSTKKKRTTKKSKSA